MLTWYMTWYITSQKQLGLFMALSFRDSAFNVLFFTFNQSSWISQSTNLSNTEYMVSWHGKLLTYNAKHHLLTGLLFTKSLVYRNVSQFITELQTWYFICCTNHWTCRRFQTLYMPHSMLNLSTVQLHIKDEDKVSNFQQAIVFRLTFRERSVSPPCKIWDKSAGGRRTDN